MSPPDDHWLPPAAIYQVCFVHKAPWCSGYWLTLHLLNYNGNSFLIETLFYTLCHFQSLGDCQAVTVDVSNVYWNMCWNTSERIKHQLDGLITSAVAVQRDYFKSTWLKASKEVGLELGFGRWAYLNEWKERISRKAANVSCTKKSVFFRRAL